jgi:hypothetical protein
LGSPLCQSTMTFDRNPRYLVVEVEGTSEEHRNVEDLEVLNVGDDNLSRDRKTTRGQGPKPHQTESFPKSNHSTVSTYSAEYSTNTTRPYSSGAAKKLSWEEMQKRREKGLCFGFNEKFTPRHCCHTPQEFSIKVSTPKEMCEEFEDGNTEIVEGKRRTGEVEPLINFHT